MRQFLQQQGMIHCIEGLRQVQKNSTCKGNRIMMSFNKFISHEVMFAEHGVKIEKKK